MSGVAIIISLFCFGIIAINPNICYVLSMTNDDYLNQNAEDGLCEMADYLDANDPDATVFAIFDSGNYFEFRGYKIFLDARPEIYAKSIAGSDDVACSYLAAVNGYDCYQYLEDHTQLLHNTKQYYSYSEYSKVVDNLNVDYIECNIGNRLLNNYLQSNPEKYELAVDAENYQLYKKNNLRYQEGILENSAMYTE